MVIELCTQINQISFDEFLNRFDCFFLDFRWTLGYPDRKVIQFLNIDPEPFLVFIEKHKQSGYSNSFITVLERVIFD